MTVTYPAPTPPYAGPVAKDSGNGNKPINRIVIHCTAGSDAKGSTGTAAYFRDENAKGSAHYITDALFTLQCAYDSVVCWHAPPNSHSLGIEMCCSLSNQGKEHWGLESHVRMMRRTAVLTAQLCLHHNVPAVKLTPADLRAGKRGICGHIDVSNAFGQSSHWDPGPYFPWGTFMGMVREEIAKIVAGSNDTPPSIDWDQIMALFNTRAEFEESTAKGTEEGNARYWRRFFADEVSTGDAALDDMRTGFMNIVSTVAGATDEAVLIAVQEVAAKVDANTAAVNRLAAAMEALAPKA